MSVTPAPQPPPSASAEGRLSQEHASALPLKYIVGLAVAALAVLVLAALAFHDPGYMDAYYAYHVAANLAAGRGFTEDFIWIYLTNPPSLSHPSHLYWMPLASLLAYPALLLSGEHFRAAQAPFLLLSAAAVITTALLARQLLLGTFRPLAAALLTLFAGYYFVYWLAVDAFGAFTLAALLAFVATAGLLEEDQPLSRTVLLSALLGLATTAAHLARADGPLLLVACSLVLIASQRRRAPRTWLLPIGIASAAYLLVMLPWFLRNLGVSGTPLPSDGLQTLFLREYNDIFSYGLALDLQHYLGEGWAAILSGKAVAALRNLGVLFGLQYWLVPFAALGWWALRGRPVMRAPLLYGALLYGVMTILFTYPSSRGAMLHSSVALLPWLSIAAVRGMEVAVYWAAARLPHWKPALATRNFTLLALVAAVTASGYAWYDQASGWSEQAQTYQSLAPALYADDPSAVPMVLNAPAWWYVSRRSAMLTPSNGPNAALAAAARYGATHLILEPARPTAWEGFGKGSDPRFSLVYARDNYEIYRLSLNSP